jgi:hypothetical protein
MQEKNDKDETLKKTLQKILETEDLEFHRELTTIQAIELGVSLLDYTAALSLLNQKNTRFNIKENPSVSGNNESNANAEPASKLFKPKLVRYRIEIGNKHQVTMDEIKIVLIEVSGVDKNNIGRLDIRNHYTLVDLPDGMSSDIFQLLADTEINRQRLNIKRVKHRYLRRNNKRR